MTPAAFDKWLQGADGGHASPNAVRLGRGGLQEQRLRLVPHADGRGRDRDDRPRSRQAAHLRADRGEAARGLHPRVDRRPERVHREGLSEERDAGPFGSRCPSEQLDALVQYLISRARRDESEDVTATTVDHDVSPRSGGARHCLLLAGWIRARWMAAALRRVGFGLVRAAALVGRLAADPRLLDADRARLDARLRAARLPRRARRLRLLGELRDRLADPRRGSLQSRREVVEGLLQASTPITR